MIRVVALALALALTEYIGQVLTTMCAQCAQWSADHGGSDAASVREKYPTATEATRAEVKRLLNVRDD